MSDLVKQKKFGQMVALRGTKIIGTPLVSAMKKAKTIDKEYYKIAEVFFG